MTSKRLPARVVSTAFAAFALACTVHASGRGRHKQLYVVPVPGAVAVDARLDDWDLSGQILSYVVPETQDMQSARTAMMYDAEALYVSCVVRDTSPMMNRHDPKTDPGRAWDADVFQMFFSHDPDADLPLNFSSFNKEHDGSVDAGTMMLWHFTDRQEACLSMYRAMRFNKPLRPDLSDDGVIPETHYKGAYRKQDDAGGYILEYRIPWATIGVNRVPKVNDLLAASIAVFWSRPDGLKTAGGAAWAYDVMSGPGFSFQSAAVWGKLVFWPENNVPAELVTAGLPPEKPLPLKFTYDLPEDSEVSVQLSNEDNQVVRMLVPQQPRRGGQNTEMWDGLDDQGRPLPPGRYTWKGIYHDPITAQWRFSVHNSGKPPYPTDNNKGGWGGDHGGPTTVCRVPGGMALAWHVCEYGWGIIKVDDNGKKQWGSKHTAQYLATDGKRLFIAGGHGFQADPAVLILDLRDSRPMSLPNGQPSFKAPPGGTPESDEVTGLDCDGNKLYVAYGKRNLIGVFNAKNGNVLATWDVPLPGRFAVRPGGTLAVLSQGRVLGVADGKASDLVTTQLDEPVAVDVGGDGTILVANRGERQDVSVFDTSGKYLRSLGKSGGRPAIGRYDPGGMYMPGGIELDAQGRLWVAETTDGPKRISVWDTASGQSVAEYFGASNYFGYGYILPHQPDLMYAHHVLWKIDWETLSGYPRTTIWRATEPNMMEAPSSSGYSGVFRIIKADNGREYGWGNARHKSILMRREGDLMKPFAAVMHIGYGWSLYRGQGLPLIDDDKETYDNGNYVWQDANDDQTVQAEEVVKLQGREQPNVVWVEPDLSLWASSGFRYRPVKVSPNGQPVYDFAQAEATFFTGNKQGLRHGYFARDTEGNCYTFRNGKGPSLIKWSPQGQMLWNYPDVPPWRQALNLPITGPGRLWGMTGLMGIGGDYFANMTYFGTNHLFRTDGMYVAALLKDGRAGGRAKKNGTDEGQPEGQNGQFVKLDIDGQSRYFVVHGGQDSRVWEVMGIDTVKDLPGGIYEHTDALVAQARQAMADYEAALAKSRRMTIARGRTAIDVAESIGRSVDSDRAFEARAAYDEKNLYLRFDVTSPHELTNAEPEPKLLFRGGNCLDIQLGIDPEADPERQTPVPGDLRLLITRKGGKPFAMLYRPKVQELAGEPTVFNSPTGNESFDRIDIFTDFTLDYHKTKSGFQALITLPLDAIGLKLIVGQTVKMDLGYIFGNNGGTRTAVRAYAKNSSFAANVTNDIPHESRLEPAEWGDAVVE